ncbi:hypothetical protein [Chamaesiphon sp. OTE_20_metabat_361]|nr:hypothetical protein [Chamaesiphon sp. OTE_20_metabat_361]
MTDKHLIYIIDRFNGEVNSSLLDRFFLMSSYDRSVKSQICWRSRTER